MLSWFVISIGPQSIAQYTHFLAATTWSKSLFHLNQISQNISLKKINKIQPQYQQKQALDLFHNTYRSKKKHITSIKKPTYILELIDPFHGQPLLWKAIMLSKLMIIKTIIVLLISKIRMRITIPQFCNLLFLRVFHLKAGAW